MAKKALKVIERLEQIEILTQLAYIYYNICFIKSVYFGTGIIELSKSQEQILIKICESTLLNKLRYSKKIPWRVLYARKSVLGIRIIRPKTIIDILALNFILDTKE